MPNVLVIDDNPNVLAMAQVALKRESHVVSVADGSILGLAKTWQECPELVLLDYTMPDMNGHAVANELGQLCQLADHLYHRAWQPGSNADPLHENYAKTRSLDDARPPHECQLQRSSLNSISLGTRSQPDAQCSNLTLTTA